MDETPQSPQSRPLEVGRVAFASDTLWRVQTLRNHVGNVVRLVELWEDENEFFGAGEVNAPQSWVIRAADIHDDGKPKRFRIKYKKSMRGKKEIWEWVYSFSGHRFDVVDTTDDKATPYVDHLVRLHHDFSVDEITKAIAGLRLLKEEKYTASQKSADSFPLDLYILEMCDQIEATLGSSVMDDKEANARVFMDFEFAGSTDKKTFYVDPFPFKGDAVSLTIEYANIVPDIALIERAQREAVKLKEEDQKRGYDSWDLRNDVVQKLRCGDFPLQTKEVTLCRWQ